MRTAASTATDVIEAYFTQGREYVSLTVIAELTGLDAKQIMAALTYIEERELAAMFLEPESHRHRITKDSVRIWRGGEWMDKVKLT